MLTQTAVSIQSFHRLKLLVGTISSIHRLESPLDLVVVAVDLGSSQAEGGTATEEKNVQALLSLKALPPGGMDHLLGKRVVVTESMHPLRCASKTYTSTLLTAGASQQIVLLKGDLPDGTILY